MKADSWIHRLSNSKLRYGIEELKYLRSCDDLKYFYEKIQYLMPRTIGKNDVSSKVPPSLQIEPTNVCNLRCICCSTSRCKRPRGYMDFLLFQKIIDEAKQIGVKHIHLYLHGEPLLHPKITEMIAYIKANGMVVHITTNGMLLDEQRIESILQSGVNFADTITFSILGFSKEVVEHIMKRSNYDLVRKNYFDFLRLRREYRKNGPIIEVRLYKLPENEHEEKQFVEYWRSKADHVVVVGKISESFNQYKLAELSSTRTRTCSVLWERMTIYWNGDVCLCCQDVDGDFILGNLRENSIQEVWHSQQLLAIKKLHLGKKFHEIPFCDRCDL